MKALTKKQKNTEKKLIKEDKEIWDITKLKKEDKTFSRNFDVLKGFFVKKRIPKSIAKKGKVSIKLGKKNKKSTK